MSPEDSKSKLPELPRSGDVVDDRYRLGEVVATGGMGVVMSAEQLSTGRTVAVKLLHPHIGVRDDFAERFKREVRVATLFDHPNIVRVYDVGETDTGALYLVMELLDGRELKDLVDYRAPMESGRVVDIAIQMLDGLGEAHSQEVVHRDLKPANIFVGETRHGDDLVKLLDFGVAKLVNSGKTDLTETGVYAGTPAYMPPEALVDADRATEPTGDVYAIGLVIMEMLTGRRVFGGDGLAQTLIQHLKNPVRIPRPVDETPLGEVIRRATKKHPADRYGNADEMFAALREVRDEIPTDLRLQPHQVPSPHDETSPSLLDQLARQTTDEGLEMLRGAPQHETFGPENREDDNSSTAEMEARVGDDSPVPSSPSTPAPSVDTGVDTVDTDSPEDDDFEVEPTQLMSGTPPSGEFQVESDSAPSGEFEVDPTRVMAESPAVESEQDPAEAESGGESGDFAVPPTEVSSPPQPDEPAPGADTDENDPPLKFDDDTEESDSPPMEFDDDTEIMDTPPPALRGDDNDSLEADRDSRLSTADVETNPEAPVAEISEWLTARAREFQTGAEPYVQRLRENPKLFAAVSVSFLALAVTLGVVGAAVVGGDEASTDESAEEHRTETSSDSDSGESTDGTAEVATESQREDGSGESSDPEDGSKPEEVSLQQEPPTARFIFETTPEGAEVVADGEELGTTSLEIELEQEEFPEEMTFRKEGYLEETWEPTEEQRSAAFETEREGIVVRLDLEEEPEPEPTPRPSPRPRTQSSPDPPEEPENEDDSEVESVFDRHFGE